jgi:hypothetical protein
MYTYYYFFGIFFYPSYITLPITQVPTRLSYPPVNLFGFASIYLVSGQCNNKSRKARI